MSKKVKATKKKLIEDYKSTIIKMSSENSLLQKQISDIETTLNINQNILYNMILNSSTEKNLEEKKNLINTLKNLWKENINLLENKNIIQEKLSNLQEASEELPNKIREEMFYYQKRNEKDKVEIKKLEEKITNLQENLKNIRRNNFHKDATIEVYVTSPNKKNVENNNEILNIISILDKLKDLPKEKEETAKKIKLEVDQLIKQVKLLKQNFYQKNNNINDITKINEEEENDDDNKFNNGSKNLKIELDKLIKEYEEMKIQCKEYEKIIEEHKRKYKNVEGKINSLKQSIDI